MHEWSAAVREDKAAAVEATDGMKRVNEATKADRKQARTTGLDTIQAVRRTRSRRALLGHTNG
jgi:hypothetical protein